MKKCLRVKCQKEFEPNKPKQVFCSAKCRVYFSREQKVGEKKETALVTPVKKVLAKKEEKSDMPDPKDKAAYLQWLRKN
ncbi:MAG: hypothetical protein ABIS74_17970 [Ferruginibacter sp.]